MSLAPLRRLGWLAGLPGLAAIVGLAGASSLPALERRLKGAAAGIATATEDGGAEPWLRVATRGRDVVVKGEAPNPELRADALARLARLPGLRYVVGPLGLVQEASPFVWSATRAAPDRIDLSGNRPAEIGPVALAALLAPDLPPATRLKDEATSARGAPPEFPAASAYAVEQLGALAPGAVVTLTDTILSFKGEAASIAAYDSLRLALAKPPDGFSVGTVDVLPPRIGDFRFSVTRQSDRVVLSGNVMSEAARAVIVERATDVANGLPVEDRMRTARGLPAAIDPVGLAGFALDLAGLLQDGSVTFADSRLSVSGATIDAQAVGEVEALVRARRPAGIGEGTVTLTTRPLSPYMVQVRRERDAISLSGHMPDEATRQRVLAALRPRFFHERIVDKLRIAQGAPPDLAGALDAGVAALSMLASGRLAVTDRALQLTGDSLYRESAVKIAAALPGRMPVGWQVQAAIRAPDGPVQTDPDSCKTLFAQGLQGQVLRFSAGSAALRADFYPVLDAVAALAKTCTALRIAVAGHGDPPGAAPVKVAPVENMASADPVEAPAKNSDEAVPAKTPNAKTPSAKTPNAKEPVVRETASRSAMAKPAPAKPPQNKAPAPSAKPQAAPEAPPEPDLPRQRALAIVDYLQKAGVAETMVVASGASRPAPQGVGLSLEP